MSVTKLEPARFDLNEGSLNIIIHNFCFVCMSGWFARVRVALCSALHAAVSSGAT